MVTVEQVKAELLAIQMEMLKAQQMEKLAFQKELKKSFGIRINQPQQPKQLTPIALQRKEQRQARDQIAEQNRKAQLALFTKRQEEMAMRILERKYARND
jgi:hypothetical protein